MKTLKLLLPVAIVAAAAVFFLPERTQAGWGGSISISSGGYCGPSYSVSRYSGYRGGRVHINTGYYAPRPVYYTPQPVYCAPRPVYYAPRPVYHAPRRVYRARVCY